MVDCKDLPIPEAVAKLKHLLHQHQLPAKGLLYDGCLKMCHDYEGNIEKPIIVDLPWVLDTFAEIADKMSKFEITDSMLDAVKPYLKDSTTTLAGA